jgi:MFS family permease
VSTPSPRAAPRATRVRYLIFLLCCGVSFTLYLHRNAWGFVKSDMQREFGLSNEEVGWLDGVFNAAYAAGQVPAGMLCDALGARGLLTLMIVSWSGALLWIGLAAGFLPMLLARITFGITQAGCYPCLGKVTKQWIPWPRRTTAQGWIATFCGRLGAAVAYLLLGTLLLGTWHWSWRWSVCSLTVVGLVVAAAFWLLFRNTPDHHPLVNAAEQQLIAAHEPPPVAGAVRIDWRAAARSRNAWVLCGQQFLAVCADNFYVYWVAKFLREEKQVPQAEAGQMVFVLFLASAVGGPIGAALQDECTRRTGSRRWSRSLVTSLGFGLAAAAVLIACRLQGAWAIVLGLTVAKFFADWGQPATWGTITDVAGRNAASVFGCVNMAGSIGGFLIGPVSGAILTGFSGQAQANAQGWQALFVTTALVYVGLCLVWLLVDCTRRVVERPA